MKIQQDFGQKANILIINYLIEKLHVDIKKNIKSKGELINQLLEENEMITLKIIPNKKINIDDFAKTLDIKDDEIFMTSYQKHLKTFIIKKEK